MRNLKTILLVGAGHSHLHCLKQLAENSDSSNQWILLSPSRYQYYSGMFSGFAEGLYHESDIRIDLQPLSKSGGVNMIIARAQMVDPENKILYTSAGNELSFDVISFDIGSLDGHEDIEGVNEWKTGIKPNYLFTKQVDALRNGLNLVVVGGGAAGTEMALSLQAWRNKHTPSAMPLKLIQSSKQSLMNANRMSQKKLHLLKGRRVVKISKDKIFLDNRQEVLYDQLLFLGGARSSSLFNDSNIPTDEEGFMLVTDFLQSTKYLSMFGAGDCIALASHHHLLKDGVNAVRQGPVLWKNLNAFIQNEPLISFKPKKRHLIILSIGNQTGMLVYGRIKILSKWAWKLKDHIDRRFMKKHQRFNSDKN